jgi:hypothetical protein
MQYPAAAGRHSDTPGSRDQEETDSMELGRQDISRVPSGGQKPDGTGVVEYFQKLD